MIGWGSISEVRCIKEEGGVSWILLDGGMRGMDFLDLDFFDCVIFFANR